MKILAITSSYPRFEGDATAPFVESSASFMAPIAPPSAWAFLRAFAVATAFPACVLPDS